MLCNMTGCRHLIASLLWSITASIALLTADARSQQPALKGLDPIALCEGSEEQGVVEFAAEHEGFVYHFANKERLAWFHKRADRWSIQFGGACARMGPLSGNGDPGRYYVYKNRIYIFASDGCRAGFVKNPDACLGRNFERPKKLGKPDFDATERIKQAVAAHGVATLRPLSFEVSSDDGKTKTTRRMQVRDAESVRVDTVYKQGEHVWKSAKATSPKASFFIDDGDARAMSPSAQHEMRRVLWQEPIVALSRCDVAVAGRKKSIAGIDVTEVAVWIDGTLTHFGLDDRHRVRTARFRGRAPDVRFHELTKIFDDLMTIDGVLVPQTVRTMVDGKEQAKLTEKRTKITVGQPIPASAFEAPK